jgi:hypothetical protein
MGEKTYKKQLSDWSPDKRFNINHLTISLFIFLYKS